MRINKGPFWLDKADSLLAFPDVELAMRDPDGLLAVGGDLSSARLLAAYRRGIFPWYNAGQPILWWSPDPRMVLFPERIHISRSLHKVLAKGEYSVTLNQAFREVMAGCAAPRSEGGGTWISAAMTEAYCRLHELGFAHSLECRYAGQLVGGIYGIALGKVFFGESMFSRQPNASKVAFVHLARCLQNCGYRLIDCQTHSAHLARFGAELLPRREFIHLLRRWCGAQTSGLTTGADHDGSTGL